MIIKRNGRRMNVFRVASSRDMTVRNADGDVLAQIGVGSGRVSVRVVVEGAEIHHCVSAIELEDGRVEAIFHREVNGWFVLDRAHERPARGVAFGRGHIFFPGCCA